MSIDLFMKETLSNDSIDYPHVEVATSSINAMSAAGATMSSVQIVANSPRIAFTGTSSRGALTFDVAGDGWSSAQVSYALKVPHGKNKEKVTVDGKGFQVVHPPSAPQ